MRDLWLVTPYFFDEADAALQRAVPRGTEFALNDPGPPPDRAPASLARTHQGIAAFVEAAARAGDLPVSIAGDCGASLPVMAGLQRAGHDPVLVWLDAHGDFNTVETSPSGFIGGMPLAMMVGRGDPALARASGLAPVAEPDVWLVGARDLDPLERVALDGSQLHRLEVAALEGLAFDRPVHLHIDNDVIDAADVPANNYPVAGGPRLAETIARCSAFAARNRLCALSLSGWNGRLDRDGRTAEACGALVAAVVAAARRGPGTDPVSPPDR